MTTLPQGAVKTHLSELAGRVHDHHEQATVTAHGRPPAVLAAAEDQDRPEGTPAIMRDAGTTRRRAESGAGAPRAGLSLGEARPACPRRPSRPTPLDLTRLIRRALGCLTSSDPPRRISVPVTAAPCRARFARRLRDQLRLGPGPPAAQQGSAVIRKDGSRPGLDQEADEHGPQGTARAAWVTVTQP